MDNKQLRQLVKRYKTYAIYNLENSKKTVKETLQRSEGLLSYKAGMYQVAYDLLCQDFERMIINLEDIEKEIEEQE